MVHVRICVVFGSVALLRVPPRFAQSGSAIHIGGTEFKGGTTCSVDATLSAIVSLADCTFSGNAVSSGGGAIAVRSGDGTIQVSKS